MVPSSPHHVPLASALHIRPSSELLIRLSSGASTTTVHDLASPHSVPIPQQASTHSHALPILISSRPIRSRHVTPPTQPHVTNYDPQSPQTQRPVHIPTPPKYRTTLHPIPLKLGPAPTPFALSSSKIQGSSETVNPLHTAPFLIVSPAVPYIQSHYIRLPPSALLRRYHQFRPRPCPCPLPNQTQKHAGFPFPSGSSIRAGYGPPPALGYASTFGITPPRGISLAFTFALALCTIVIVNINIFDVDRCFALRRFHSGWVFGGAHNSQFADSQVRNSQFAGSQFVVRGSSVVSSFFLGLIQHSATRA
ncbi:hypothetical protein BDN70DRAFT_899576 [Pholiota conissans]|uniref:Uncharacterized protein n=1 Tax=Pholiota conissans TaxID=109636 RepID=A0A9P5YRB7_9AGAR|nr:hypothetical protein BDN70DRAFT_899576 [Pholiota conissans]